ncbi:MAG: bifunctional oligoribonuclease/PAP phosphatase NrnA [Calditrichales bacterium]|nr:MAG: bifunctional oligoribonuclease/PAP phosphatase NrnA [Calditrichales bacterium]
MRINKLHKELAEQILTFLESKNQFLLSAHVNADGDAIASVVAVGLLLDQMGKKYHMLLHDAIIDSRFSYLENFDKIHTYNRTMHLPIEAAVIMDVPGLKRLGNIQKILPDRAKIARIDHHPTEDDFAAFSFTDVSASSTTQLVYEILEVAGVKISSEMAHAIYTGIVYDTGRFSFSNTKARDMYICGKMIEAGVEPSFITNRIFFENSFEGIRTIGRGLAKMESYLDDTVNVIYLDNKTMCRDHQGEIEELANYSVAIRGGKVGVFIRELQPRFHKVSLRTKVDVDVNRIAKSFGGGGHIKAAGCRIEGTKREVIKRLLSEIKKQL